MTLRTLNYGNYGIFLIMGNAGFCPSTVVKESGEGTPNRQVSYASTGTGSGPVGALNGALNGT